MFSGLIQATTTPIKVSLLQECLQLELKRPQSFKSLKEGESIAVDGLCLTLEKFDSQKMIFKLSVETLKITKWTPQKLKNRTFNLERSLTLKQALGGHLLTGHIDGLARVMSAKKKGKSLILKVKIPSSYKPFFTKKGYIALNGLSLTVNKTQNSSVEVCLVPKTLKLTSLSQVKKGDLLNFEVDYLARIVAGLLNQRSP